MAEKEIKCEECGSTNVKINRHHNDDAEEGSIESTECRNCGHRTPYYQISKKGKEILKILLSDT